MYIGKWELDDLITFTADTHDPSTGAETDADAVPQYRLYEDETGAAILTGSMALLDDANTVGHYSEQITLSAANGFELGKSYSIRIRAVVGGIAGATERQFQVEAAPALASALATAQTDLDTLKTRLTVSRAQQLDLDFGVSFANIQTSISAIWNRNVGLLTTTDSIGKRIVDYLTGDIFGLLDTEVTDIRNRLPAALVSGRMDSSVGAMVADVLTAAAIAAGAIDAAALAADMDGYTGKLWVIDDNNGTTDRYIMIWFKNGAPVTSGITVPTLQVVKASDGTDLIASGAMTEIGALGLYKKDEATNRIVSGASYIAKATATIGGSSRIWYQPLGRDSS